jgi:hypothetical protein
MPIVSKWDLSLDVDQILRGQGADPAVIRARSPALAAVAERALEEGTPLLDPKLLYRQLPIARRTHERILFENGSAIRGALIARHLARADEVVILLCTVGHALEARVAELLDEDMVFALALDGLGSAGVEALAQSACATFEQQARAAGLEVSVPLSPGMIDWPVEQGQPQIFELLEADQIGVQLTPAMVMRPKKSLSMVLGVGAAMIAGSSCDYCSMQATCRYQDHYP